MRSLRKLLLSLAAVVVLAGLSEAALAQKGGKYSAPKLSLTVSPSTILDGGTATGTVTHDRQFQHLFSRDSNACMHYFLAMTEHHLGNTAEASGHLEMADNIAEAELARLPAWNRKLTLEILRKKVEVLPAR